MATWRNAYRGLVPDAFLDSMSVPARADRWAERMQAVAGTIFVIEEGGRLSAFADFGPVRDRDKDAAATCELYAIYILPECQGRGWGRALYERGLAWARGNGYWEISVLVLEANLPARGFYRRMGFAEDGMRIPIQISGHDLTEIRLVAGTGLGLSGGPPGTPLSP